MAFADLKSEEAQARLSVCQPISGLQEVTRVGGVERYPAVVVRSVRLSYARHMRAYVICGLRHMRDICGMWTSGLSK